MKRRYPPALIIALVLWILVAISTTVVVAYMFRKTPTVNNHFDPASVSCEVVEKFNGEIKTSVTVKNNGNIASYIRLRVITYWVDSKGNVVARSAPENKFGKDGGWSYNTNAWLYDADEQTFYCRTPVAATASTPELLKGSITLEKVTEYVNGIQYTYHPVIEFIAEAIQSKPTSAVTGKWGVTLTGDIITATP